MIEFGMLYRSLPFYRCCIWVHGTWAIIAVKAVRRVVGGIVLISSWGKQWGSSETSFHRNYLVMLY